MRQIRRHPLAHTIPGTLILLLVVVVVPLVLVQAGVYLTWLTTRRASEFQSNLEVARVLGLAFDAFLDDVLHQQVAIGVALTPPQPVAPAHVRRVLEESRREYPTVRNFSWVSPAGRVVASTEMGAIGLDVSSRGYFQQVRRGQPWAVSDLLQSLVGGQPIVLIARGIRVQGRLLGVVVAAVDPARLHTMLPVARAGGGAIALVDQQGRLVYQHPPVPLSWQQRSWPGRQPLVRQALAGREVTGFLFSPGRRARFMAGAVPIRPVGWVAIADRPVAEAMAPVNLALLRDTAIFLFVLLVAFVAALYLGRSITIPISRLEEHARALGQGELGRRLEVERPTEVAALAQAFNAMADQIRAREEERDLYLHTISHDLRIPLTLIQGHAELLRRSLQELTPSAPTHANVQAILVGVHRLNTMIEDLVDSARLEIGRLALVREPLALADFVPQFLHRYSLVLDAARIQVQVPPGLPPVWADPMRLERILANLLSNALRYSEPPSPVVLAATRTGEELVVSVTDQGVGIAPQDLPHLFQRFYRASGARGTEGLGLGLYISRMLVTAHGGRIWVQSTPGRGSTFSFSLPLAGAPSPGE